MSKEGKRKAKEAKEAFQAKEYRRTGAICRELLDADESNFNIWLLYGASCLKQNDKLNTIQAFRKAAILQPDRIEPLDGMAKYWSKFASSVENYKELAEVLLKLLDHYKEGQPRIRTLMQLAATFQFLGTRNISEFLDVCFSSDLTPTPDDVEFLILSLKDTTSSGRTYLLKAYALIENKPAFDYEVAWKSHMASYVKLAHREGMKGEKLESLCWRILEVEQSDHDPTVVETLCWIYLEYNLLQSSAAKIRELCGRPGIPECKKEGFQVISSCLEGSFAELEKLVLCKLPVVCYSYSIRYLLQETVWGNVRRLLETATAEMSSTKVLVFSSEDDLQNDLHVQEAWLAIFTGSCRSMRRSRVLLSRVLTPSSAHSYVLNELLLALNNFEVIVSPDVLTARQKSIILAKHSLNTGKYRDAEDSFLKLMEEGETAELCSLIALSLWYQKKPVVYPEVSKYCKLAQRLNPRCGLAYTLSGLLTWEIEIKENDNLDFIPSVWFNLQEALLIQPFDSFVTKTVVEFLCDVKKQPDEAIARLQVYLEDNAEATWAWLSLALLSDNDVAVAIKALLMILRQESENSNVWSCLVSAYYQRGSFDSALKVATAKAESFGGCLRIQYAWIRSQLGECVEAIDYLNDDTTPVAAICRAMAALKLAQAAFASAHDIRAVKFAQKALRFLHYDTAAYTISYQIAGEALTLLVDASVVDIEIPTFLTGTTDCKIDVLIIIANSFKMCLSKEPIIYASLWNSLAMNYLEQYKLVASIANGQRAVDCATISVKTLGSSISWQTLGVVAAELKLRTLAARAFSEALRLSPRDTNAWVNLAAFYLDQPEANVSACHQILKYAQATDPANSRAWLGQAMVAQKVGHVDVFKLFLHCSQMEDKVLAAGLGLGQQVLLQLITEGRSVVLAHGLQCLVEWSSRFPRNENVSSILSYLAHRAGLNQLSLNSAVSDDLRAAAVLAQGDVVSATKLSKGLADNRLHALCLALAGKFESALQLVSSQPETTELNNALACLHVCSGDRDLAKTFFFKSSKLPRSLLGLGSFRGSEVAEAAIDELGDPFWKCILSDVDKEAIVGVWARAAHENPHDMRIWAGFAMASKSEHAAAHLDIMNQGYNSIVSALTTNITTLKKAAHIYPNNLRAFSRLSELLQS